MFNDFRGSLFEECGERAGEFLLIDVLDAHGRHLKRGEKGREIIYMTLTLGWMTLPWDNGVFSTGEVVQRSTGLASSKEKERHRLTNKRGKAEAIKQHAPHFTLIKT